jgi:hypothetical protein
MSVALERCMRDNSMVFFRDYTQDLRFKEKGRERTRGRQKKEGIRIREGKGRTGKRGWGVEKREGKKREGRKRKM